MSGICLRLSRGVQQLAVTSAAAPSVLTAGCTSLGRLTNIRGTPQQVSVTFRALSTTQPAFLKEIVHQVEGTKTIVEGKYVDSPHAPYLVPNKLADKKVCPLCALQLNIKHTDVLLLSQFVRADGRILPRRVTGLCCSQQYKITMLITMSKKAGLMANLAPANSHKDPTLRRGSKKHRRYFDESTIKDTRLKNYAMYKELTL